MLCELDVRLRLGPPLVGPGQLGWLGAVAEASVVELLLFGLRIGQHVGRTSHGDGRALPLLLLV